MNSKTKKLSKSFVCLLLISIMLVSLTGCGGYKYNYKGESFKFQYDENTLVVDYSKNQSYNDVFVHTNDGLYLAYVNVSLIDAGNAEPRAILDVLQSYFESFMSNPYVCDTKDETSTGKYNNKATDVVEHNYTISGVTSTGEQARQVIRSKIITIGDKHFVVVERYFDDVYDDSIEKALNLTYDSALPTID